MKAAVRALASQSLVDIARRARSTAALLRYRGKRLTCPLCGHGFRSFLPYGIDAPVFAERAVVGAGRRGDCVCPFCRCTDRDRLLFLYLTKHSRLFSDRIRLLHIAPEAALASRFSSSPNIEYFAGDLDSPLADIRLDVTELPFRDGWFDWVICNHVLEHVPDDSRAMRELRRVLRLGGIAILQVPMSSTLLHTDESPASSAAERLRRFGQKDHVRLYGRDFPERVCAQGFQVEMFDYAEAHGIAEVRRYALPRDEKLMVFRAE